MKFLSATTSCNGLSNVFNLSALLILVPLAQANESSSPTASLPYLEGDIVIDGTAEDAWNFTPAHELTFAVWGIGASEEGLFARWRGYWSEKGLTLLLEVEDDEMLILPFEDGLDGSPGFPLLVVPEYVDSALIYVRPMPEGSDSTFKMTRVAYPYFTPIPQIIRGGGASELSLEVEAEWTSTETGFVLETRIPWSLWPEAIDGAGLRLEMEVSIFDVDVSASGSSMVGWAVAGAGFPPWGVGTVDLEANQRVAETPAILLATPLAEKGFETVSRRGWVWSTEHGYLYLVGIPAAFFFYDVKLGAWLYSSENHYPWMYRFGTTPGWLLYNEGGSPALRHFYDTVSGEWIKVW